MLWPRSVPKLERCAERRRLAAKAKLVCRSVLRETGPLVTPDTLLRWHWQLVAKKYSREAGEGWSSDGRGGDCRVGREDGQ